MYPEPGTQEAEEALGIAYFEQQQARKYLTNVQIDALPPSEIDLPMVMQPPGSLDGSYEVAQFYLLADKLTGVLALGNFSPKDGRDLALFQQNLLRGLKKLKFSGATRLLVDVVGVQTKPEPQKLIFIILNLRQIILEVTSLVDLLFSFLMISRRNLYRTCRFIISEVEWRILMAVAVAT